MTSTDLPAIRAWSFKSLTKTANGVQAYPDELAARYVYDNKVKNGRHVKVGDLAVIQDSDYVLGAGWIDGIEATAQGKIRYRCPLCGNTDIKKRATREPAYWCSACHKPFDLPTEEPLDVETYTADYSRTFKFSDRYFPAKALDSAYIANAKQNSIRELDVAILRPLLERNLGINRSWWNPQLAEDGKIAGGYTPGQSKNRIGQQRFREALLARNGEVCAFTGPQHPAALEAAHLVPYAGNPEHDVKAGLLLRCDLHTLFDRQLITIDPDTWSVQVAPELMKYPGLAALAGRPVFLEEARRPLRRYVEEHAMAARASWK